MSILNIVFVDQDMKLAMYLKNRQEHSSVDAAQTPASARHALPPSNSAVATSSCTAGIDSNLHSCFEIFIYLVPILPFVWFKFMHMRQRLDNCDSSSHLAFVNQRVTWSK